MNKVYVGGICCLEGEVNDLGVCKDTCSPERPIQVAGICGRCSLPNVDVGGICCPEGQVNDDGLCKDTCSPDKPINLAGICLQCFADCLMGHSAITVISMPATSISQGIHNQ